EAFEVQKEFAKSREDQVSCGVTSKMEKTDYFRPTAPGHSPGVGHSVHN
ncbi:hypothetical protein Tco_1451748, partial [Tanacetum coccineum]